MNPIKLKSLSLVLMCLLCISFSSAKNRSTTLIKDQHYTMQIQTANLRIGFTNSEGKSVVPMADTAGLYLNDSPIVKSKVKKKSKEGIEIHVINAKNQKAEVRISFSEGISTITVEPENPDLNKVTLRFGGMPVAHGLGDAGAYRKSFNLVQSGNTNYDMFNNGQTIRWLSTFAIFPVNNFAGVFFDKGKKSVRLDEKSYQLINEIKGKSTFYFFVGDNREIYANYKKVRSELGYEDIRPQSRLFELGWETWDALGWNTSQITVKEMLEKFHSAGYPIRWAVTGSGFWEEGATTTSFGKWGSKFPDAPSFKAWMNDNDIKWMIGLRTNFVPSGGPFPPVSTRPNHNLKASWYAGNVLSDEAIAKDYFLKDEQGSPLKLSSTTYPQVFCFMLDGDQPGAARWFQQKYTLWNVNGIKEDTMMPVGYETSIFTKPISEIEKAGDLVMARNGEFVSPGTLLRINDTKVIQMQQRIPNNYLQYAASGAPNVYSDVAGVFNMRNLNEVDANIRHSWLLALTAGMAVGVFPEDWPVEKQAIFKKTVDFHYSLVPYLYGAAMQSYHTGFPYTLTPLSIAYADDSVAVHFDDYQWMIGESVLATPLLKNYKTGKRDIYLPEGVWYEWETGRKFTGPVMVKNLEMPLPNVPAFVGGKGIVVLRDINTINLFCRVYDMGKKVESDFYTLDKGEKYSIRVLKTNFNDMVVVNAATNEKIDFVKKDNYLEFKIVEGQSYIVN
jgi:alpha-glucosidase (family GH31 glycosyl hydrolase)